MSANASNIKIAIDYLKQVIRLRLQLRFLPKDDSPPDNKLSPPKLSADGSPFYEFIKKHTLSFDEFVVLLLALAPHVQPDLFVNLVQEFMPDGGDFPEFGGAKGGNYRGFLPTGETAAFTLAYGDYERRFNVQALFNEHHFFYKENVLRLDEVQDGEPALSGKLIMSTEYIEMFTSGGEYRPKFSTAFPAKRIETRMTWDDLVLNYQTFQQIDDIKNWTIHHETLMNTWGMKKKIKPGYRALFYGPPGTGKSLTAALLGKYTERDVYKIDLSMVVSKYIGETEKNLSRIFDQAEHRNWILFFDEADSIFGKRTSVQSSNDKYANQEVSFLLQRIEDYDGLVILASNLKSNIDTAFLRRFHSVIYFPTPDEDERLALWKQSFPKHVSLAPEVNLKKLAAQYELTGALIINVVQHCCLRTLSRYSEEIQLADITDGIQKEFFKQGKTL